MLEILKVQADSVLKNSWRDLQTLWKKLELPLAELAAESSNFSTLFFKLYGVKSMTNVNSAKVVTALKSGQDVLNARHRIDNILKNGIQSSVVNHKPEVSFVFCRKYCVWVAFLGN